MLDLPSNIPGTNLGINVFFFTIALNARSKR